MPPNDEIRLRHMLDAAREAVAYAAGLSAGELAAERVLALGNAVPISTRASAEASP